MPRQCFVRWGATASLFSLLMLSGCETPPPPPSLQIIHYHQVGESEITNDTTTGMRIRTTHWRYDDGYTVDTIERIPINGTNEFRRNPLEPRVRFGEDD